MLSLHRDTVGEEPRHQDEETPITTSTVPEMPGGFVNIPTTDDSNESNNVDNNNSNHISNKMHKIGSVISVTLLLIIMIPMYILLRVFIYFSLFILSLVIKIQKHGYKSIRNNDPANISRRFIRNFDDRIGNKARTIINDTVNTDATNSTNGLGTLTANSESSRDSVIDESHLVEIERPDFMECAYSQALYIVKRDIKWLLIYIESDSNKECIDFTNDVLIDPKFLKFIKERNFLVWGGNISESEAFQVCNEFNITKLPFLGLLCLTVSQVPTSSGLQQSPPILSLVSKIQGYKNINTTLNKLEKAYKKYNPTINQLRMNSSTTLQGAVRNLQEEAYENSLRRTQPQRQQRQQRRERERENQERLRLEWLKWRKSKIEPECAVQGEYARIAIRLPDNKRVQLKINKSCSTEEIYAIVECNLLNEVEIDADTEYQEPQGYTHDYGFSIYSLVPRQLLNKEDIISDNSLVYPSGNFIVEIN